MCVWKARKGVGCVCVQESWLSSILGLWHGLWAMHETTESLLGFGSLYSCRYSTWTPGWLVGRLCMCVVRRMVCVCIELECDQLGFVAFLHQEQLMRRQRGNSGKAFLRTPASAGRCRPVQQGPLFTCSLSRGELVPSMGRGEGQVQGLGRSVG